jgi:hypothetical protein
MAALAAEVRLQRVRNWQRSRAGSLRGGRRPSLPSDAVLRWFLASQGWGLDTRGRVTVNVDGRAGTMDLRWVARRWFEWAAEHDLSRVPARFVDAVFMDKIRRDVGEAV